MIFYARKILVTVFLASVATVSAVPQISVVNNRTYRATSGSTFDYRGGNLRFIIYDGNAFSSVECPFLDAGPGLTPFFPGEIPCPPGHNAFVTTRFGDRGRDVRNLWARLGTVTEATRVPSRLPSFIRLVSAPITDLPRPSNDFSDRSTLVLHDLQSATFREKEATFYEMLREYRVADADTNGDGVLTDSEREASREAAKAVEIRHLRETIIRTGNSNGYLFTYPILPWIRLNRDVSPDFAPRDEIAVNRLQLVEAFPGISNRAGITNTREGFFFKNLENFGTDYDGDPALLVDFRDPSSVAWDGTSTSNLIGAADQAFLKVFEKRYTDDGTPISFAGIGEIPLAGIDLSGSAEQAVAFTASVPAFDPVTQTQIITHNFEDGEEVLLYRTGFSQLDGKRFYVSLQSERDPFDVVTQFELAIDEGLTIPLVIEALPDGTLGSIQPTDSAIPSVPDITIVPGAPASVVTLAPHGLTSGDSIMLEETGLTAFELVELFVDVIDDNTVELYSDSGLTEAFEFAGIPALTGGVVIGTDQNDFEFPIWPFSFVDQNFGGQLLLPSVFDKGYEFPDATFRLFYGTPFGARNLSVLADPPRNDLIMRLRFARAIADNDTNDAIALLPGDVSRRDFEIELCLVDTIEGATKALLEADSAKASRQNFKVQKSSAANELSVDGDLDGDGQSNLFEFAFDASGSMTEELPAMANPNVQIAANVSVVINSETQLCELTVHKRPGVREYLEYFFEEVSLDGSATKIDPTDPTNTAWELVEDNNLVYKLVSTKPVSGSSFYRAAARKNTFGVEIVE